MNRLKRLTGKKMLLTAMALCAFGFAKAQTEQTTQNTLTLTLDKALEIALDENPTIKVAAEEIALKKVASKEAWQSLLPEASLNGSLDHTIKAAEMKLNDMSFKMGQDGTNTANAGLSINLPLFAPGHVNDKDGYRTGSGEVACFRTGFDQSGNQGLLSADACTR